MSTTVVMRMTLSQQMAMVDFLLAYMLTEAPQTFVDVSRDTTTTPGELLSLAVASLREVEVTEP